jgi:hemerythrin-like domain-containing protein
MTQQHVVPAEDAEMIHEEHVELRTNLGELDQALDRLHSNSGYLCDLSGASEVWSMIRRFQAFLPLHFQHEEKGMLERVSVVSPELMELTLQLKNEHQYLADLFAAFAESVSGLKWSGDLTAQITRTKLLGNAFTNHLLRHMATEETELAGFL